MRPYGGNPGEIIVILDVTIGGCFAAVFGDGHSECEIGSAFSNDDCKALARCRPLTVDIIC